MSKKVLQRFLDVDVSDWTEEELAKIRDYIEHAEDRKAETLLYCFKLGAFELHDKDGNVFYLVKLGLASSRKNKTRVGSVLDRFKEHVTDLACPVRLPGKHGEWCLYPLDLPTTWRDLDEKHNAHNRHLTEIGIGDFQRGHLIGKRNFKTFAA